MKTTFTVASVPCPVLFSRALMTGACLMLAGLAFVSADAFRPSTHHFPTSVLQPRESSEPAFLQVRAVDEVRGRYSLNIEVSLRASQEAVPLFKEQSGSGEYADWTLAHFIKATARDAVAMMSKWHSKK